MVTSNSSRKIRIYKDIEPFILDRHEGRYINPFVGFGDNAMRLIKSRPCKFVWLNDADLGITSIWKSVYYYPRKFTNKVTRYNPKEEDLLLCKEFAFTRPPKTIEEIVDAALIKIISSYRLNIKDKMIPFKWDPKKICNKILYLNRLLKRSQTLITSWDFEEVLNDKRCNGVIHLEPPTFGYKQNFSESDHWRLSEKLYNINSWVMAHEDCPQIRRFYSWANIYEIPKKKDVIITHDY